MTSTTQSPSTGSKGKYTVRFGYAAAEIGTTLSFYMISSYLAIFYTDCVGLSPMIVSGLMLVVRIIEAVAAPITGGIIDKTSSRWGKCRPWLLWGLPFLALFSILTFSSFNLGTTGDTIYAYVTYIGLVIAFSFVDTAKSALVNTITIDAQERVVLNSWRSTGANIANLALAGVTMPLILFFGNGAKGYWATCLIFTALSIPVILLSFATCKETVVTSASGPQASFLQSLTSAVRNPMLLCLMVYNILTLTGTFARLGTQMYYYNYTLGRPDLIAGIMMVFQFAQLIPPFIVPAIVSKVGKRNGFFIANIGQAASVLVMYVAGFDNIPVVFVGTFFLGFFMMNALITYSATSDCIEYGYYRNGQRTPATTVGAVTLSVKVGLAIGGSLGILLIGVAGYSQGVEITDAVRGNINLAVNVFPAVMFLLGLLALIPYTLSNKRVAEIQEANAAKDAEAANGAE